MNDERYAAKSQTVFHNHTAKIDILTSENILKIVECTVPSVNIWHPR